MTARAIEMAREIRAGASHGPYDLYTAALGDHDVYQHAMREAGFVVPKDTNAAPRICEVCGHDFGSEQPRRAVADGPVALKREDMTPDEIAAIESCTGRDLP